VEETDERTGGVATQHGFTGASATPTGMKLSIVTTLYHSAPYVRQFYERVKNTAEQITDDYEIVLVNDGSPDDSLRLAVELHRTDPRVKVIDLSRNFGHHKAAMTGLMHARGNLIFQIDVDLEEEPELLKTFYDVMQGSDADVIFGVQDKRKGGLSEQISGAFFYAVFNLLSGYKIPPNLLMARLMTRRYATSLVAHRESELDIGGLWTITGFKQVPVTVRKHSRGTTTYSFGKKLALMIRSITAFTNRPLIYIAAVGVVILALSFLYFLYIVWVRLFVGEPPSGFTTLILSMWFLGGLTIFSLGVIAIYLSVIFVETKNRPYTIIRQIYGEAGPE
jgi:putative glycosyltransferase